MATRSRFAHAQLASSLLATLSPGFFGGLLTGSRGSVLQVDDQSIVLTKASKRAIVIPLRSIAEVAVRRGVIGAALKIKSNDQTLSYGGVTSHQARQFAAALRGAVGDALLTAYQSNQPAVRRLASRIDNLSARPRFLAHRDLEVLKAAVSPEERMAFQTAQGLISNALLPREKLPAEDLKSLEFLSSVLLADGTEVRLRNERFVRDEIAKCANFFDTVEQTPLTQEQRVAAVVMEDRNLLVAAAGSGKTSTIVGKIGYALLTRQCAPEDLLLLAFNNDAAKELDERANSQLKALLPADKRIKAKTFHALGLEIIATAQGKKPSVAAFAAGSELSDSRLIEQLIAEQMTVDPLFAIDWLMFRSVCFKAAADPVEFKSKAAWQQYVRIHGDYRNGKRGFLTMAGEIVKSQGELAIANWLYMQGIDYEYERPYEHDTASVQHRQYQPDFYFPDIKTYLEHYALDENGAVPAAFGEKYAKSMEWKQRLHADKATELIVTTFADFVTGRLFPKLETELKSRGQRFAPRPINDVLKHLNEFQRTDYASLLRTFIKHAKSNEVDEATLLRRAVGHAQPFRALVFARAFAKIMTAYQRKLRDAGEIDFEDMIVRATQEVTAGRFPHSYKLILVDELQDISQGRGRLVSALLAHAPDCKLFAVGDDWQSIYRFAGSDIEVLTNFSEHFGVTATNFLTQTFRSNQGITDVASQFIQKNTRQLSKRVVANDKTDSGVVVVRRYDNREGQSAECEACLAEVASDTRARDKKSSVFILGRYRHQRPERLEAWQTRFKSSLDISFRTIHSSKGLQADHVIILGLSAGRYAFPSEISDDPLLQLVMPTPEVFANAEERRLFYVAMTRARHRVFLLGSSYSPSVFLTEVVEEAGSQRMLRFEQVNSTEQAAGNKAGAVLSETCPSCGKGVLRVRRGQFGEFLGCSTYPSCGYTRTVMAANKRQ